MTSIPTQFSTFGKAAVLALAVASTAVLTIAPEPALAHGHKRSKAQADLVDTAAKSKVHTTLVTAVQAADLVDTLKSDGPFTVFAPTDTAFAKLPEGTVASLVQPKNKGTLAGILTYHVVAGRVRSTDLVNLINSGGGEATIKTVSGGELTARLSGNNIVITDAKGRATAVTKANVTTSNGIIHFTDGVFLPA
ncbi:MAG: fasciclin domain-containing protein [Pseudomonadota bacterium]